MKSLRKSFLTLLALTLFGGAGAWAQGPTNVTQFTTDMIASWATDNSPITLADMQDLGFEAVDAAVAASWTGAPQDGYSWLVFGFNDIGYLNYIPFDDSGDASMPTSSGFHKSDLYDLIADGYKFFYTGAPSAEIELTPSNNNHTWTLGQTPDYDLELQVEYYEAHALKDIPAGWTVMVNGVDKTAAIDHDSLMIVETDSVTLVPAGNPRRVKSVTLSDETVYYTIPAIQGEPEMTINVAGCTTWQQIVDRNPGKFNIGGNNEIYSIHASQDLLDSNNQYVLTSTTFDPNQYYHWFEGQH